MTGADATRLGRLPYPGLDPFGFAQRDLFCGRDAEGRVVSAMLATEPLSIVTGASGTGKSSLIRASVVPTLFSRGWCVVYAHPGANAEEELRHELLAQALPDIDRERSLIARVLEGAASHPSLPPLSLDSRLSELYDWYGKLPHDDPCRTLVGGDPNEKIPLIPLLALLMSGLIGAGLIADCLAELAGVDRLGGGARDPTLREMEQLREAATLGRQRLVSTLCRGSPKLPELAARVWGDWLQPVGFKGLAMVLDQAEEMYSDTGGVRLGAGGSSRIQPRTTLRHALLDRQLLAAFQQQASRHPLRLCFSLRPEWYTHLRVSLGPSAPDETTAVHILKPLEREQAAHAITQPAAYLEGEVDPAAAERILQALELQSGGDGVDPFLLGLITHQAWNLALAAQAETERTAKAPVRVGLAQLETIAAGPPAASAASAASVGPAATADGLAEGALMWLVHNFLSDFDRSEKFDALDMLDRLFTSSGTRRIVARSELVERPLRPRERLVALLDRMAASRLVRLIQQGDQQSVEIRHDRLAQPLLSHKERLREEEKLATRLVGRYRSLLGSAIDMLLHYDGKRLSLTIAERLKNDPLPGWARESLRSNRLALAWDAPAARLMLASLLHDGPAAAEDAGRSNARGGEPDWADYRQALRQMMGSTAATAPVGPGQGGVAQLEQALFRGLNLSPAQLAGLAFADIAGLQFDARMLLLDALLRDGGPGARPNPEEIRRWTWACLALPMPS